MKNKKVLWLTTAAMIAAVYLVLTMIFYAISFAPMQSRLAEALTVLPYFTPVAIPGLFIGCILANIIGGYGIWDVVIGSLTSLLAAYLTYKLTFNIPRRKWLAPLPPILLNAVIVGAELNLLSGSPTWEAFLGIMLSVCIGQIIACYVIGFPLMLLFERSKKISELFKRIS